MKIKPVREIYLVERFAMPETKGKLLVLLKEDRQDHLYLGKVIETGAGNDQAFPRGSVVLYVASAGWKLQHCPHGQVIEVGERELVLLKEEDIVARVE